MKKALYCIIISFSYTTFAGIKCDTDKYNDKHDIFSKINFQDKTVLNVGYRMPNMPCKMLDKDAIFVTTIDINHIIDPAKNFYKNNKNLKFIPTQVENYWSMATYDLITSFDYFNHGINSEILRKIFSNLFCMLEDDGQLFFTIDVLEEVEGESSLAKAFLNILPELESLGLPEQLEALDFKVITCNELVKILEKKFEIKTIEYQAYNIAFIDQNKLSEWAGPIIRKTPYVAQLSEEQKTHFINRYIEILWDQLSVKEGRKILDLKTVIVHAKKQMILNGF